MYALTELDLGSLVQVYKVIINILVVNIIKILLFTHMNSISCKTL